MEDKRAKFLRIYANIPNELKEKVLNLKIGEKLDIYKCADGTVVFITRPEKVAT